MTFTKIRQLIEAATPGPWVARQSIEDHHDDGADNWGVDTDALFAICDIRESTDPHYKRVHPRRLAEFIAASRQLLPLLLDVAEAADDVNANQYHTPDDDCRLCAASHRLQQALAKLKEYKPQ